VVVLRNLALPLQRYGVPPISHDGYLVGLVDSSSLPAEIGAGYGKLFFVLLFAFEKVKSIFWRGDPVASVRIVQWPALYDLFLGSFIVAFSVVCSRFRIRPLFARLG